jgi:hypothetical protein
MERTLARPRAAEEYKQISYWETGERQPGRDSLNKLAFLYRCSAGVLLGGEDYSHLDPAAHNGTSSVQLLSVSWPLWSAPSRCCSCAVATTPKVFWGWPTGVVKPGRDPAHVAVIETLAETGVHCAISSALGTRIYPMTGALCAYYLCDHLAGEPENRDQVENIAVAWAPIERLTDFIPINTELVHPT